MYISGPSTGLLETLEYQQNNFSPHFCSATIIKFSSNGTLVGCHIENHFFIPKTFCLRIRQIAFYRKKNMYDNHQVYRWSQIGRLSQKKMQTKVVLLVL